MTDAIQTLRNEGAVIGGAPWSFFICVLIVAGVIFGLLRALKAQEIEDLKSRLTLRNDEISDYQRKLNGASPDEAKARLDALEATVASLKPRRLSQEARDEISAAVRSSSGSVLIMRDMAAAEVQGLAADFAGAFQAAGWRTSAGIVGGIGNPPPTGLAIEVPDPSALGEAEGNFLAVLNRFGLQYDVGRLQQPGEMNPLSLQITISSPLL